MTDEYGSFGRRKDLLRDLTDTTTGDGPRGSVRAAVACLGEPSPVKRDTLASPPVADGDTVAAPERAASAVEVEPLQKNTTVGLVELPVVRCSGSPGLISHHFGSVTGQIASLDHRMLL